MKDFVIYEWKDWVPIENAIYVIGTFESLHLGHFQLFDFANKIDTNFKKIVVFFNNNKMPPKTNYRLFTDEIVKEQWLSMVDFDYGIRINFPDVSHLDGNVFLKKLTNNLKSTIIVGEDFKFGNKAQFNVKDIVNLSKNFTVHAIPTLKFNNVKISTTRLKEHLEFGNIELLNSLLVSEYSFIGEVNNDKSVTIDPNLETLHSGIYATYIISDDIEYYGILHVDMKHKYFCNFIDFNYNYNGFKKFEFRLIKEIRKIVNLNYDTINNEDLKATKLFFLSENSV